MIFIVVGALLLCIVSCNLYTSYRNSYYGSKNVLSDHFDDFNIVTSYIINMNPTEYLQWQYYSDKIYEWDNGVCYPAIMEEADNSIQNAFKIIHKQKVDIIIYKPNMYILYIFKNGLADSKGFAYVLNDEALNESVEGEKVSFTSYDDENMENWYYYEHHTLDR